MKTPVRFALPLAIFLSQALARVHRHQTNEWRRICLRSCGFFATRSEASIAGPSWRLAAGPNIADRRFYFEPAPESIDRTSQRRVAMSFDASLAALEVAPSFPKVFVKF